MIARFQPIQGTFIAGAYPKPQVFTQRLEAKPGADTFDVRALGIRLTLSAVPCVFINVDLQWNALQKGIEQLEKANILLGEGVANITIGIGNLESQRNRQQQIAEKAPENSEQRLAAFAAEEAIGYSIENARLQIKQANQDKESNQHQIENLRVEQKQLGSRDAAELYHTFQPLNITARLIATDKETVWMGSLKPSIIPSGSLINEIVTLNGFKYKMYAYEEAFFIIESQQDITPTAISEGDPLELEISILGPTEWEVGPEKSGVGLLRAVGAEKSSIKHFAEIREKQVSEGTAANLVKILACALTVNYEHVP